MSVPFEYSISWDVVTVYEVRLFGKNILNNDTNVLVQKVCKIETKQNVIVEFSSCNLNVQVYVYWNRDWWFWYWFFSVIDFIFASTILNAWWMRTFWLIQVFEKKLVNDRKAIKVRTDENSISFLISPEIQ